jgi:transcriptional regulator with XRE-family HTH domain/KaiC/GvpD/RAD55 family RecA-like ATPase
MNKSLNPTQKSRITSGVSRLDRLLGSLFIGDNVVWQDGSGSLASVFCLNFIQSSLALDKPLIYVSFDRPLKNLLEKLGQLASNENLIILDCFSGGKGSNSSVFLRSHDEFRDLACRILRVQEPRKIDVFRDTLYEVHAGLETDVRFVFESITGMQELWGGEDNIISFYSDSCARLCELSSIAYWIMEKKAHSPRLRAQINQIAQVVIELSLKRGSSSLSIIKAQERNLQHFDKPFSYWTKDLSITFDDEKRATGGIELGHRLKELRTRRGFSQTELARLVGVTPSTISQIESSLIYPSLPALLKMTEVLTVDISSFFQDKADVRKRIVFPESEGTEIKITEFPEGSIQSRLLIPVDFDFRAEPYLIEIPPDKILPSHFFVHKGDEVGYMIEGELQLQIDKENYSVRTGDVVYLTADMPSQWKNLGGIPAKLLWIKVKQ